MSFLEDLAPYFDRWGMLSDKIGNSSGNGIIYWAEALIIAKKNGDLYSPVFPTPKISCLAAILQCEFEPGFYRRHPVLFQGQSWQGDQESIDDYAGLACISKLTGEPRVAQRILDYGRTHSFKKLGVDFHYYYPNEKGYAEWDIRAWLGRFPALIASLTWAGGGIPCWAEKQWWAASMRFGSVADDNSARLLRVQAYARGDEYWEKLVDDRIKKQWGSIGALYAKYFDNPNHPFVRWA